MLRELTSVHVNHDITINLTEMMANVYLKDNYVLNMFRVLICSRVKDNTQIWFFKHYYIKMGIKKWNFDKSFVSFNERCFVFSNLWSKGWWSSTRGSLYKIPKFLLYFDDMLKPIV
jgi:hypothetical protein